MKTDENKRRERKEKAKLFALSRPVCPMGQSQTDDASEWRDGPREGS